MTGSEVGRILACPASAALPRGTIAEAGDGFAEEGEDRHADAEIAVDLGDMDSLPRMVAKLIDGLPTRHTEVVFSYDAATDTARVHLGVEKRAYPEAGPFEIYMTLDLLALGGPDGPRRGVVIDHKLYADQGKPREHGQLLTQALAVARVYGLDEVTIAISYLGTGWVDHDTIDVIDLDAHAAALRQVHIDVAAAARTPAPYLHQGRHCRYCPAFYACPEQNRLASMIKMSDVEDVALAFISFSDDQDAADTYEFVQKMDMILKRARGALIAHARENPIPLDDGRVYGSHTKLGNERLDGDIVYTAVNEAYGRDFADLAVERSATKKKLKEAAQALSRAGHGKATVIEKAILYTVRERGGAERKTTTVVDEHIPALEGATTTEETEP